MGWFEKLTTALLLLVLVLVAAGAYVLFNNNTGSDGSANLAANEILAHERLSDSATIVDAKSSDSLTADGTRVDPVVEPAADKSHGPFGVKKSPHDSVDKPLNAGLESGITDDTATSAWLPGVDDSVSTPAVVTRGGDSSVAEFSVNSENSDGFFTPVGTQQVDASGNPIAPIRGRVVDDQNQVVAGYLITLTSANGSTRNSKTARSNKNGVFIFKGLSKGEYILKTQDHPFFNTLTQRVRSGASDITLKLSRLDSVQITGTITDEFEQPIIGAEVFPPVVDEAFLSAEDGAINAAITATPGQGLLLRVAAKGFLPATVFFSGDSWVADEPVVANVKMRRGSFELAGIVYDEQGYSVPSALVQITSKQARLHRSAQTDEEGRFTIDQVLVATDYQLKVTAGIRFKAYEVVLPLDSGMSELQIPLAYSPIGGLSGRVVDESDLPVESLSMMVLSDGAGGRAATITTSAEGRYSLNDFVAGEISLRSRTPPSIVIENLRIEPGLISNQDLIVDFGSNILEGLIVGEDGGAIESAELSMRYFRQDPSGYKTTVKRSTTTDNGGNFLFEDLGAGERVVTVKADGYRNKSVRLNPSIDPGPHNWMLEQ